MKSLKLVIVLIILFSVGCTKNEIEDEGLNKETEEIIDEKEFEEVIDEKESDKISIEDIQLTEKINIYLFWGDGCPVCENLLKYFDSIEDEYGKLYNLVKYEIWYNEENQKLLQDVSSQLNQDIHAIPYLVIGDTSMVGYNPSKDEYIKETIIKQYMSEERVDLVKNLED